MNNYRRLEVLFALAVTVLFLFSAVGYVAAPLPGTAINGHVTDAISGLPIAGATVTCGSPYPMTKTTDANGFYSLGPLYAYGTYTITASKTGYVTQSKQVTVVYRVATPNVNFAMSPLGQPIVSGTIRGQSYDYVRTYILAGATVTAKQETAAGQYTGVVSTATSGPTGYYSLSVAGGWTYHMIITYHDHTDNSYLHLGVYSSKTQDFTLRSQWRECPQPWELTGGSKDPDNIRIFERDIDGNGVIDSLNLFLDANTYWEGLAEWFPITSYDSTKAAIWIELQGYRYGNGYNPYPGGTDVSVFPYAYLTNVGYYGTNQRMVLHATINVEYRHSVVIPQTPYHQSYTVFANQLILQGNWGTHAIPYPAFCAVGKASTKLQKTLSQFNYAMIISSSDWPLVGDGTGIYDQMASKGYPNTQFSREYAIADLNSWPVDDRIIRFDGNFQLIVKGENSAGVIGDYYWCTYYQSSWFGFSIDN